MKRDFEEYFLYVCTAILLVVYIFASGKAKADNEIFVDQTGNNFAIGIEQVGANNSATVTADGTNQQLLILQYDENNDVAVDATGDNNGIKLCQGCAFDYPESYTNHDYTYDSWESGGHSINLTVTGSGNGISAQQTNQGNAGDNGHSYELNLTGDNNEVTTIQQHDGAKTIDLTIYNDENDVFVRQKGSGANHNATVELDGTHGTDLTLKQFGNVTQSYSLQQNCLTVGGCSVTITQQ
ncbi:hypothetical protein N8464_00560 [bacterium]|nr:hypothetical protein [bacterium]